MQIINHTNQTTSQTKLRTKSKVSKNNSAKEKKKLDLNDSFLLKELLLPDNANLQYLDKGQRKIVEKEFERMIKGVKKQIKTKK